MSKSGRFTVIIDGRKFVVEPVGNCRTEFGEYNDQQKYPGSIKESDSIITPENGFDNIVTLQPGENPLDYIESLCKKKVDQQD